MSSSAVSWRVWLQAARPRTWAAAVAPILSVVGHTACDPNFSFGVAFLILTSALAIQVTTNYANDLYDFLRGADASVRLGPPRVMQGGLVSVAAMRRALFVSVGVTILLGLPLVLRGGVPILVVGILSLLAGIGYTAGPYPLAYLGLGELFVVLFFGPVATVGTSYLLTFDGGAGGYSDELVNGLACGLLAAALLVVNNVRDRDGDAAADKMTIAVRLGDRFARWEYLFLVVLALSSVPLGVLFGVLPPPCVLASVVAAPVLGSGVREVLLGANGAALNRVLDRTALALYLVGVFSGLGGYLASAR